MGFFKDNEDFREESRQSGRYNRSKWVATVVISALVGSGASFVAIPILINNNVIPNQQVTTTLNTAIPINS